MYSIETSKIDQRIRVNEHTHTQYTECKEKQRNHCTTKRLNVYIDEHLLISIIVSHRYSDANREKPEEEERVEDEKKGSWPAHNQSISHNTEGGLLQSIFAMNTIQSRNHANFPTQNTAAAIRFSK